MTTQKTIELKLQLTSSGTKDEVCQDLHDLIRNIRGLTVPDIELGTEFEFINTYAEITPYYPESDEALVDF